MHFYRTLRPSKDCFAASNSVRERNGWPGSGPEKPNNLLPLVLDKVAVGRDPVIRCPAVVLIHPYGRQQYVRVEFCRFVLLARQGRRLLAEESKKPLRIFCLLLKDLPAGTLVDR